LVTNVTITGVGTNGQPTSRTSQVWTTKIGDVHRILDEWENVRLAEGFQRPGEAGSTVTNDVRVAVQPHLRRMRQDARNASPAYDAAELEYTGAPTGAGTRYNNPNAPRTVPTQLGLDVEQAKESGIGLVDQQTRTGEAKNPTLGVDAWRDWHLDPDKTTPDRVRADIRRMDPATAKNAVRYYMEQVFADAFKPTQGTGTQPNPKGGGTYASKIIGKGQGELLFAMVDELHGSTVAEGVRRYVDMVGRTGQGINVGSTTAGRTATGKEAEAGGTGAQLATPKRTWEQFVNETRYKGNYEVLAKVLADPESVRLLRELGQTKPDGRRARILIETIGQSLMSGERAEDKPQ
jgi:hypothetical protein